MSFDSCLTLRRACAVLAISGFWYGSSRPSPSPIYKGQNDLPVAWSGQIPFVCICMTLNATGLRIANYLRFWKERRQAGQRPTAVATTDWNAGTLVVAAANSRNESDRSGRKNGRRWLMGGRRARVAPDVEVDVNLGRISEGSERVSSTSAEMSKYSTSRPNDFQWREWWHQR